MIHPEVLDAGRDEVINRLRNENIGTGVHYKALHLQPYFVQRFGFKPDDFPNARFVSDRTLSLPLSTDMTEDDVLDVIAAVHRVIAGLKS
jgi:dTDP-4-amino-4,6-dideoxygalactose transaminase